MAEEEKQSSGLLSKVKEAAATATAVASDKISEIKDNVWDEEKAEIVSEFKDKGAERVKQMFMQINDSVQILNHSGFNLTGLGVSLGVPPDVSSSFTFKERISDEARAKVLEEAAERKIVKLLIKCLFKANDFYDKIELGGYKLQNVDIVLGLAPGVAIKFKKMDT